MPSTPSDEPSVATMDVALEVVLERQRQDDKWGQQDHPWVRVQPENAVRAYMSHIFDARQARLECDLADRLGRQSFARILIEEVAEALEAPTISSARDELIQVAAVAIAAIEAIDRGALSWES